MKKPLNLLVALLLVAGFAAADEHDGSEQIEIKGHFQETWVMPDAEISKYDKLYPWKAIFEFRDVEGSREPRTTIEKSRGGSGPYKVAEEDQQKFEEVVGDAFLKELSRSKQFEVVDELGPNTLLVRARFVDIVSNVPGTAMGSVDVYIASLGQATLIFELIDAETGVVQATAAERREILPPARATGGVSSAQMNPATIWNDIKNWSTATARELRKTLDKAHKKADQK